jgi:hypothetical protein
MFKFLLRYQVIIVLGMVALMSGILSIAREVLLMYYPDQVHQRPLFWGCVRIAFIVSGLLALYGAHSRGEALQAELMDERNRNRPEFVVTAGQAVSAYFTGQDRTIMFHAIDVLNKGADSVAIGWKAHYKSPTLDADVETVNIIGQPIAIKVDDGNILIIRQEDIFQVKGMRGIARGHMEWGRFPVSIPGDRMEEINNGAEIWIELEDYTGRVYKTKYQSFGKNPRLKYSPMENVR